MRHSKATCDWSAHKAQRWLVGSKLSQPSRKDFNFLTREKIRKMEKAPQEKNLTKVEKKSAKRQQVLYSKYIIKFWYARSLKNVFITWITKEKNTYKMFIKFIYSSKCPIIWDLTSSLKLRPILKLWFNIKNAALLF